jgi:hypothetical protein
MLPEDLTDIEIMHVLLRLQHVDPGLFSRSTNILLMDRDERSKIVDRLFVIAPDRYFILLNEFVDR